MMKRRMLSDWELPQAIRGAVASACRKLRIGKRSERLAVKQRLMLRYYFGGQCVAYIPTGRGIEILAVAKPGDQSIRRELQRYVRLTPAESTKLIVEVPAAWEEPEAHIHSPFAVVKTAE